MTPAHHSALALGLQHKVAHWAADADEAWEAARTLPTTNVPGSDASRRELTRVFVSRIGSLPTLPLLACEAGPWALLDRPALIARLCVLALLGRPGVLRSCVQRDARLALQSALGAAYGPLRARAMGAMVVPADVASWSPTTWAWVGWRELLKARAWPHRTLRRLARTALPRQRTGAPPLCRVPPACAPVAQRLVETQALLESEATS